MKLLRYGNCGEEKPALLDEAGHIRDLFHYLNDFNPEALRDPSLIAQLQALNPEHLPMIEEDIRIGACIANPGKLICVGLNSVAHAAQMGLEALPAQEMVLFLKATSSICGPNDPILYTTKMQKLDWEAELAIVIGKKGKYIREEDARNHIFGYTCMNDLSERYWQLETCDKQFTKGKSFDNAAPLGPYMITRDELLNVRHLEINLWVNDELRQHFNTADYLHHDAAVVSYVSQFFTLYPGDVISMGTGAGNAASWQNQFLKPGDRVRLSIQDIGQQMQEVIYELKGAAPAFNNVFTFNHEGQ